jgi:hypothetical protein
MNLTLTGGTSQQRQWVTEAIRRANYPFDDLDVHVFVTWPAEPSLPGHKEFAATTTVDGINFALEIRASLDSSTDPDYSGRAFYEETVIHEIAHVITFARTTEAARQTMCPCFYKLVTGEGVVHGTAADLNPGAAPWGDRIQEAMAEIIKDTILANTFREYDNRTNWQLDPDHFLDFMAAMFPTPHGGLDDGEFAISSSSDTLHDHYADPTDHLHIPPDIPISWLEANTLLPADPGSGWKIRFRWYIPVGYSTIGGAVIRYDIWAVTNELADPTTGVSLIGGQGGISGFPYTGLQNDVNAGDEGVIEFDFPVGADLPEGYNRVAFGCYLSGPIHPPLGESDAHWYQTSYFTAPAEALAVMLPDWPYKDPFVVGGGGDSQVFRAR